MLGIKIHKILQRYDYIAVSAPESLDVGHLLVAVEDVKILGYRRVGGHVVSKHGETAWERGQLHLFLRHGRRHEHLTKWGQVDAAAIDHRSVAFFVVQLLAVVAGA